MRIVNDSLIDSSANLGQSWTSPAINLSHIINYSIQLSWTGSPVGVLKLQCSNDKPAGLDTVTSGAVNVSTWTDIADSDQIVNAAGNHTWQAPSVGYMWVRVVWTPTSGTGTLVTARFTAKGV